jgi:adhesin transport system outer membrane protein
LSAATAAQGFQEVTIDEAARLAVAWHPSITEATARVDALEQEIDAAKAGYLPQVSAGIGSGYDNLGGARWRPRANVSASQMLFDFGKVDSDVAFAEAGVAAGEARVLLTVDGLIRDTAFSVIEIQRSAALNAVAEEQLASVRGISRLVRARFESGAATKSDALQAEARVGAAEATIQEIGAERRRWQSNLAYLLGRARAPDVAREVPANFMTSCNDAEPNWQQIPAIREIEAQREQAMADLDRARSDALPTISLGAGGATDVNDPFSHRAEYNFGINVSSSIFNGGASRARTRGASYALGAASAAEARVRNEVGRVLDEARRQVSSFQLLLNTLSLRETQMRETGSLYQLQYLQMGTKTLVDLLNAEQELHQVRFDLVNREHDLRRLQVECLVNSGSARAAFGLEGTVVKGAIL